MNDRLNALAILLLKKKW